MTNVRAGPGGPGRSGSPVAGGRFCPGSRVAGRGSAPPRDPANPAAQAPPGQALNPPKLNGKALPAHGGRTRRSSDSPLADAGRAGERDPALLLGHCSQQPASGGGPPVGHRQNMSGWAPKSNRGRSGGPRSSARHAAACARAARTRRRGDGGGTSWDG